MRPAPPARPFQWPGTSRPATTSGDRLALFDLIDLIDLIHCRYIALGETAGRDVFFFVLFSVALGGAR
jgi:hypothetical protein